MATGAADCSCTSLPANMLSTETFPQPSSTAASTAAAPYARLIGGLQTAGQPLADGRINCTIIALGASGFQDVQARSPLLCYPPSYGQGECRAWDSGLAPLCATEDGEPLPNRPRRCDNQWCYVDASCRASTIAMGRSRYVTRDRAYYSYHTCGSAATTLLDSRFAWRPFSSVQGSTLRFAVASANYYPVIGKLQPDGTPYSASDQSAALERAYLDDALPYSGAIVDYLEALRVSLQASAFTYHHSSVPSRAEAARTMTQ
jgi:hypothetical protein